MTSANSGFSGRRCPRERCGMRDGSAAGTLREWRIRMPAEHGQHDRRSRRRRPRATCQPWRSQRPTDLRLGIHVRQRDAGRRAEPDHRAAEADRVGQEAPVVAALLERQRGQRDVVEHRRDEAEAERGLPGGGGQLLDRHHRRAQHQREQEDACP